MANVNEVLVSESGRILPDEIKRRTLHRSPWIDLVPKGAWPDEMGEQISIMTYERTLPTQPQTWTTVTFNDGTGNGCVPTASAIAFAQTLRTYNLQQTALEGPNICVDDLRFAFRRRKQLEHCFSGLADNATYMLGERARDEYVRLSSNHVIAKSGLPSGTTMPSQLPTSRMTGGILKSIYLDLIRDGASRDGGSFEMVNGQPQFVAILSPEMDDMIVTEDYEMREDFRNVDSRAPELLQPLGVNRPLRGFYHIVDPFPPRYNWSGSAWTRVYPYAGEAATYGTKQEVNSSYKTATYEDTIIFVPTVYTCLVPRPVTTPGGNTEFKDYYGRWKWRNIADRVENPDENWGYFRGVFHQGSEPGFPQFGYVIRHLRADCPLQLVDADGNTPA